jgi:hypothetical protein
MSGGLLQLRRGARVGRFTDANGEVVVEGEIVEDTG